MSDSMRERQRLPPILPPATIGILGSGQLGRMLALVARRMGYGVAVFSPERNSPTGQIADREFCAPYDDLEAVRRFASLCAVVTWEFENVPASTAAACADVTTVRPGVHALAVARNRLREKQFFTDCGLPVAPFAPVANGDELQRAIGRIGLPAVLKSAESGYDGKGQRVIREEELTNPEDLSTLSILEQWIPLAGEISVVAARGVDGWFTHYGAIENEHRAHILHRSVAPARVPAALVDAAVGMTRTIAERLDYVGTLAVEFFITRDGALLVNEMAPRPHNSGHLTIEGCAAGQFEQQLRAVCGLPPGDTRLRPGGAAMVNLLGDLWQAGDPPWERLLAEPAAALHLYGKAAARPGRKMGHVTVVAESADAAATRADALWQEVAG